MITRERVVELLAYDPETGEFRRRVSRGNGVRAGSGASGIDSYGYIQIRIDGVRYKAHRLAWLIVTGAWPKGEIDHINGVRSDNRFANPRDVSHSIDKQNQQRAPVNSKTGCLGVTWHKRDKKFQAQLRASGRRIFLGHFDTLLDAAAARKSAELRCFPEKPR